MCCIAVHDGRRGAATLDAARYMEGSTVAKIEANPLLPPLRASDFAGKEALVCRVKAVKVNVPSERGKRGRATFMELWEFEGKGLYLNATSQANAVAGFGSDETDHWTDKPVPVIVVNSEFEDPRTHIKTTGRTLWIAAPEDWKSLLRNAPKASKVQDKTA